MTDSSLLQPFLRQLPLATLQSSDTVLHSLSDQLEVLIGRDPRCQIVLDSSQYSGVSRQHAKLCPVPQMPSSWQVCDLNSANGTYVNGQRIQGCRTLQAGDRIMLGQSGPEFIFELSPATIPPQAFSSSASVPATPPPVPSAVPLERTAPSGGQFHPAPDSVTMSQLFPILSSGQELRRKAYLIPGVLTVTFVVLMFVAIGNPLLFNLLLAAYISGAAFYFVYQLCGKHKPWWVLLASGFITILLLISPVLSLFILVFREILPGSIPEGDRSVSFLTLLVQMFFGAGLMEELLKAIPILLFWLIGHKLRSPLREKVGVWEPLDGILLGAASAVGFTLLETLGQYVPNIINDVTLQAGEGTGQLVGLQLLIPRVLGSIAGHMAYSGYFGYFIGLSILKPSKRFQILIIGYLTASGLHALWNASGILSFLVLALVGVTSYAFLAAAILKARMISPTRSQNFATRLSKF